MGEQGRRGQVTGDPSVLSMAGSAGGGELVGRLIASWQEGRGLHGHEHGSGIRLRMSMQ